MAEGSDGAATTFEELRSYLFSVAYRLLGSVSDAEDAVQDTFLRWQREPKDTIRSPRAFLATIVVRLCVDQLRSARARREVYVGPWLPEPLITSGRTDLTDTVVLRESLSFAFLLMLEVLSPLERAVFVLREAFGLPFAEIATTLDRGESAVRQLAARARRHVDEGRPRYEVDPAQRRELTERFLAAATEGDLEGLMSLLAPDVTLVSDSGGKARAPLRIIETADKVARFFGGVARKAAPDLSFRLLELNGGTALLSVTGGRPDTVFQMDAVDGRIQRIYLVRNPDKLMSLMPQ
jgi:RNA polymerase sigma-70 factor (ECF subfamily)